jgi:hypothetical protein
VVETQSRSGCSTKQNIGPYFKSKPIPLAERLRRGSAANRLLGLRIRIPPGNGFLSVVSVVCCQVEVSATSRSLVQRSPTDSGVSLCVI